MKKSTNKQPVNRTLYHGDSLMFLRGINSETIDLIATDPPFNKGKDFHVTPESLSAGASFQDRWSWDDDVDGEWVDKLQDDFPKVYNVIEDSRNSYGDDMGVAQKFPAWNGSVSVNNGCIMRFYRVCSIMASLIQ